MLKGSAKLLLCYARALERCIVSKHGRGEEEKATPSQREARVLAEFARLFSTNEQLRSALCNPVFSKSGRREALELLCERAELSEELRGFVLLLFDNGRISILLEVSEVFSKLADDRAGLSKVELTVAKQFSSPVVAEFESALGASIGGELLLSWKVDPSILGGVVIRRGAKVVDASLLGRLRRLERRLSGG